MHSGRKQDLSVIYWLKNHFDPLSIGIVDGFPEEAFTVPSIAVEWDDIDSYLIQMGSTTRGYIRS